MSQSKKLSFGLASILVLFSMATPFAFARPYTNIDCTNGDLDRDGYIDANKVPTATDEVQCSNATGGSAVKKLGGGDCVDNPASVVTDDSGNKIKARDINPGATDMPNNGVDENCDGADDTGPKSNIDAQGLLGNVKNFLTWIVGGISGIVLIIGGIMYTTAAGDEQKTKKARKAMIGAIVGLLVALLANVIISIVTQNIVK